MTRRGRWPGCAALLALLAPIAAAADLVPEDFALGLPLAHDVSRPYVAVTLPPLVYRTATTRDLADLRVFDAGGAILRHALVLPPARAGVVSADAGDAHRLPLFPVHATPPRGGATTRIEIAADGSLVASSAGPPAAPSDVTGYVLDAAAVRPARVRLSLAAGPAADSVVPYAVDGSEDLVTWSPLIARARLVRLAHAGRSVVRDHVDVEIGEARYLRVRWLAPAQAPRLEGVVAQVLPPPVDKPLEQLVLAAEVAAPDMLVFDAGGHFALRELALEAVPNQVFAGRLEVAASSDGPWRQLGRGTWFALEVAGETLRTPPRAHATAAARYVRFIADDGSRFVAGDPLPALRFAYRAHELRVLASGRPPYLLAVGSSMAARAAAPPSLPAPPASDAATDPAALIGAGSLGAARTLGGSARLAPLPEPLPWRRLLLWGVLVVGVAGIAMLVWRLLRELDEGVDDDGPGRGRGDGATRR